MHNLPKVKYLILRYNNKISHHKLPSFRAAIKEVLRDDSHVLLFNDEEDGPQYIYPLIQCKRINGQAAIVCIEKGIEAISLLMADGNFMASIGCTEEEMELNHVNAKQALIQTWNSSFTYYLQKWLPLNNENYDQFLDLENSTERYAFFEKNIIDDITSMAEGLNISFNGEVTCKITQLTDSRLMKFENLKIMAFDLEFYTNVSLPDYFAIGKGADIGFGVVVQKREIEQE